jgi:hypothetical protein
MTCSNGHWHPKDGFKHQEVGLEGVQFTRAVLFDNFRDRIRQESPRWRPGTASRGLPMIAAGLFFVVISIVVAFAISVSSAPIHVHTSSAAPALASSRPDSSTSNDSAVSQRPAPQGTDLQGFLGYPDARCNSAHPAVAIGRTANSLIVICQNYAGRFYYKGFGLKSGRSNQVDNFVRADGKFNTTENEVAYLVSPTALIIRRGSTAVVDEPMLEYWAV